MAEIKVSQLPEATQINDNDLIMIVQNNVNKKITKENCQFASGDEVSVSTTEPTDEEKIWVKTDETTNQARYKDGNIWKELSIKALDSMVIGSIIQFVGTTIPTGWLECDGSTITQSAYPELYALIGGTLPDFRGKVLVGQDTNDTDFATLCDTGGSKELQAHNHGGSTGSSEAYDTSQVYETGGSTNMVSINWGGRLVGSDAGYRSRTTHSHTITTDGTGNSGNLQPYGVVKHIIKAKNTTPTMASVVNATNSSTTDAYSCDYINGKVVVDSGTGYVKYGDGTMICYGNKTDNATENSDYWGYCRRIDHWDVTFPVAFISTPSISAIGSYQAIISVVTSNLSATGVRVTLLTTTSDSGLACTRSYMAVGKWK